MPSLPMSPRKAACEQRYLDDKASGRTKPLELENSLKIFNHWRIIENRYCYCIGYKTSHMVVVNRAGAGSWFDLNAAERAELDQLKREFIYNEYDQIIENCPHRRSVPKLFHLHLVSFHDVRDGMTL